MAAAWHPSVDQKDEKGPRHHEDAGGLRYERDQPM